MPFEVGHEKQGGRQLGTPNRATTEFKEFWQQFFESYEYRENLKARLLAGKADHMERYTTELLYGKPKQDISVEDQSLTVVVNRCPHHDHQHKPPVAIEHQPDETPGSSVSELNNDDHEVMR